MSHLSFFSSSSVQVLTGIWFIYCSPVTKYEDNQSRCIFHAIMELFRWRICFYSPVTFEFWLRLFKNARIYLRICVFVIYCMFLFQFLISLCHLFSCAGFNRQDSCQEERKWTDEAQTEKRKENRRSNEGEMKKIRRKEGKRAKKVKRGRWKKQKADINGRNRMDV